MNTYREGDVVEDADFCMECYTKDETIKKLNATIKAMITDFMTVLKGDELNKFLEVYSEEIKDIM